MKRNHILGGGGISSITALMALDWPRCDHPSDLEREKSRRLSAAIKAVMDEIPPLKECDPFHRRVAHDRWGWIC